MQLILAAMAPELMLAVAVREYLDARQVVRGLIDCEKEKNYQTQNRASCDERTIVSGFYVVMGGLQVRYAKASNDFDFDFDFDFGFTSTSDGGQGKSIIEGYLSTTDFLEHLRLGKISLNMLISEREIQDKGKADNLIKCMLAFQVLWLTVQCISRAAQGLTITPFELSTLAYVPFMLLTLAFWWKKPYHIETPTLVDAMLPASHEGLRVTGYLHRKEIPGFEPTPYQSFGMVRECLKVIRAGGVHAPDGRRAAVTSLLFFVFGGLHCAAWNFPFPTLTEQWAWRISSLVVATLIPLVWMVVLIYWLVYRFVIEKLGSVAMDEEVQEQTYWHGKSLEVQHAKYSRSVLSIGATACVYLYILARLCLVCQIFVGLRSLPADCYRTVQWLEFVPGVV